MCDADASWAKLLATVDLVVEAVPEDLKVKHEALKAVEGLLRPDAVFATNTSALPISSIAAAAAHPSRVVGMHYFSPVDKMPLLEIIPHAGTDAASLAVAYDVGLRQGKTPIVVKDVPGFFVNRCLAPFASEALLLVQGGVDPARLDAVVKAFGYPVGPVTLADEVGVDVLAHTLSTMRGALGVRMTGPDEAWLKQMLERRLLGRKTGAGFFKHDPVGAKAGRPTTASASKKKEVNAEVLALMAPYRTSESAGLSDDEIVQRMVLRFVKEAIHALEDGVIASAADGDLGAVFGLGFPPFLGGPFRYVDRLGARRVADNFARLAGALGAQFAAPELLLRHAKDGTSFHGR